MMPLRVVQVGAGMMGRAWLRLLVESSDVQLVGLVDLDAGAARVAVDEAGLADLPIGASLEAMLDLARPDAVVNVTVPTAHRGVSSAALLRGVPVLSEKPLADTVSAGIAMMAASERGGQLLMVSQSRRYFRPLTAFRRQIAEIGPVGLLRCDFFKAPLFGGFREEMAYPLLIDMAIHQFDLARDLSGSEPVTVHCVSFNPSWSWFAGDAAAQVSVEFASGAVFSFTGSWVSPGLETSWNGRWRVSGANGTATWDGDGAPVAGRADGSQVAVAAHDVAEEIAGGLADFVDAVRTGRIPSGEVHANLLSLAMVEAAIRSAEEKRTVTIAEVLEDAYAAALAGEQDPDLRAVMEGWTSIHEVVGPRSAYPAVVAATQA